MTSTNSKPSNTDIRGAILPQKFEIDDTEDSNGEHGVAITMVLPTGDRMTFAISDRHASDLAIGLATFLAGPAPEVETGG